MLAAAALMGGSQGQSSVLEISPSEYRYDNPTVGWEPRNRQRRNKTSFPSQRKIRKNRRRTHAAGIKNAFK